MDLSKEVKLIQKYLEAMPNFPPVSQHTVETATLKDIRPRGVSQQDVAIHLGRKTHAPISRWEQGKDLDGIKATDVIQLAVLYNRDILEVHAAIENTRLIKEKNEN